MGSLMAGWDSPTLDPKSASLERNRSLTKEEINAYWRSRKEIEEEHRKAISSISENTKGEDSKYEECEKSSGAMSLTRIKESIDMDVETSLEQLMKKNGWWTKSSWAFLNEPPVMEAASNKYASQFHVADLASSKFNSGSGISA